MDDVFARAAVACGFVSLCLGGLSFYLVLLRIKSLRIEIKEIIRHVQLLTIEFRLFRNLLLDQLEKIEEKTNLAFEENNIGAEELPTKIDSFDLNIGIV